MSPFILAIYIGVLFISPASKGHESEGPSESECRPYIEKALQGVNTLQNEDEVTLMADEGDQGLSGEESKLSGEEGSEGIHDEEDLPVRRDGNVISEESLDEQEADTEKSDEDGAEETIEKDQSVEENVEQEQASEEDIKPESEEQTIDQKSAEINEEVEQVSDQPESEEQVTKIDESRETISEDTETEGIEELFDETSTSKVDEVEPETTEAETSQEINEKSTELEEEDVEQQETGEISKEAQSDETEKDESLQEQEQSVEEQQPSEEKQEDEASEGIDQSDKEVETEEGESHEVQHSEEELEKEGETEESQPVEEEVEKDEGHEGEHPSEEDTASTGVSGEGQQSEEESTKEEEVEEIETSQENIASKEEQSVEEQVKESVEELVKESVEEQSAEEIVNEVKSEEESTKEDTSKQLESEEKDVNEEPSKEIEEKDDITKSEEGTEEEEEEESPKSEAQEESVEITQEEQEKTVESGEVQQEESEASERLAEETEKSLEEETEKSAEETKLESEEQKEEVSLEVEKESSETEKTVDEEKDVEEEVSQEGEEEKKEEPQSEPPEEEELIMVPEVPEKLRTRDHMAQILHLDTETEENEKVLSKTVESTLKELKKLYDAAIKPLEILYKYRDLSNRHFGDPEIFSKPLILFMGPWSGGKSTIINYLLENEYKATALRTGADPSPAYFNIVMWGEEPEIVDGTQLAADWTFSGLQKFGQGLLDRLRGLKLNHPLLQKVNIVEIPGILEIRKQVERLFPFNDACQWFIDRADIIFLVYDPSKLDIGPETEAILDQLKGREMQTRIILNKADQVKPEELMRVQGTLIWNISPLMSSTEPPVMYSTSLWSLPYEAGSPTRLLHAQEKAFLTDLRSAIDKRVENKIAGARRFAVRVRNHAKMVDCYLTTYYNHKSFFDNKKHVSDDIIEHPQNYHIYEGLSTLTNISRYDLPDPDVYRDFFRLNPVYEFQQLSATCTYFRGCPINRLDLAIAYDLPELIGKYKKSVEELLKSYNNSKK